MTLLERLWAYVTLGAMGSLWGEASPLLGGLAAHQGRLDFLVVAGVVALGTWLGVLGFYVVGRSRGKWVRRTWPRSRPLILRAVAIVRRHPWRASLGSRFAYGVRIALPIACGMGRVPIATYASGTAISCIAWAGAFTSAGWFMGRATRAFLGQVQRMESVIGVLVAVAVLAGWLVLRRRDSAARAMRALDHD